MLVFICDLCFYSLQMIYKFVIQGHNMNKEQLLTLDKLFKSLSQSKTVSIALARSNKLHKFILEHTTQTDIYMAPRTDVYLRPVLVALKQQVFAAAVARI